MLKPIGLCLLLLAIPAISDGADFYLSFDKCKLTIGYLVLSDESLKTFEGDPSTTMCTRVSQTIRCTFTFLGTAKPTLTSDEYKVHLEIPPTLIFTNANMSDYYVIDQSQHAVTLITRVLGTQYAGAKVCTGTYVTQSERNILEKREQK